MSFRPFVFSILFQKNVRINDLSNELTHGEPQGNNVNNIEIIRNLYQAFLLAKEKFDDVVAATETNRVETS